MPGARANNNFKKLDYGTVTIFVLWSAPFLKC
jgi:hypothetical protein